MKDARIGMAQNLSGSAGKCRSALLLCRHGSLQQPDDLGYRHCPRAGIAGRPAQPKQEAAVPGDAIAHLAKAGTGRQTAALSEASGSAHPDMPPSRTATIP